ncbi:DUF1127 domain-containing protein [Marinivivus vitaminiproducens]|uniref:DUF1127 domain-containing protein n=1 Tax=Marinivivus vitaminiproducens TaxID=3035935 RepID=UPI00279CA3E7|nr:DUF1127 domain-containing protein [Geminicoccaceae bacterium SCSIO 64248]
MQPNCMLSVVTSQGDIVTVRPIERSTGIFARVAGFAEQALDSMLVWQERHKQRLQLRELSQHMRHDIGLTDAEIETEANKPFWRA